MGFNGSGTFNRAYSWTDDAANGIKIRADRMDTEDNGFATGLTTCLTKDGQTAATANLPMGGFHHTNVSDASATTHYSSAKQVINGSLVFGTATGTVDAIVLTSGIAPTALAAGQRIVFVASGNNTGAVTVNRDSLGAKNLYLFGSALSASAIKTGDIVEAVYDGTKYNLISPLRAAVANANWTGTPLAAGNGGTGLSALTAHYLLVGNGTSAATLLAPGTSGLALLSQGASADPAYGQVSLTTAVTGILPVANGGTGGSTQAAARTGLGLGSLATASTVNDSNWSGTDLSVANGGTGSSTASGARTNLGLGTGATANITVSAASPSGGNNGDLWFKT